MGPAAMPSHAVGGPADEAAVPLTGWRGTVRRSSIVAAAAIIGYRLVVDYGYRVLVAGPFSYQGYQNEQTTAGVMLSWGILLVLLPLLVRAYGSETLSGTTTTVLALISLVPTTTLIAHDTRYSLHYILLIFVYWLLFLLAAVFLPSIKPLRRPMGAELPHLLVVTVLSIAIIFISWKYTGFRLHFGLFDVYDIRSEAREYNVATLLGYLATIADNTLPVLLAYYLRRRWFLVAAAVGTVILFNFGISATKQVLFLLVFAIASFAIGESARLNRMFLVALVAVVAIGIAERLAFGTLFVGALGMHRIFIIPAQLHWVHYDFFQTREVLHLTQSALRFFFESPYKDNVQFLLGEYFIGEFTARANNGLFSDGYMNFGGTSVLYYPVLCVALVKLVEGAAHGLAASVRFVVVLVLSFVLQGVPLPTAILSSGIGMLILLLPMLPRQQRSVPAAPGVPA
jgi:hypothetical protein